jgi:hypothetical protein
VFSKIAERVEPDELLSSELNTKETLTLFIRKFYDVTNIVSDVVWVEDF